MPHTDGTPPWWARALGWEGTDLLPRLLRAGRCGWLRWRGRKRRQQLLLLLLLLQSVEDQRTTGKLFRIETLINNQFHII